MRALVFIVILAVIVLLAAVMTGYVNITNLRGEPPQLTATRNAVTVRGGQSPAFDVEAGSVKIGSEAATVNVPTLKIEKPSRKPQAVATNNMM